MLVRCWQVATLLGHRLCALLVLSHVRLVGRGASVVGPCPASSCKPLDLVAEFVLRDPAKRKRSKVCSCPGAFASHDTVERSSVEHHMKKRTAHCFSSGANGALWIILESMITIICALSLEAVALDRGVAGSRVLPSAESHHLVIRHKTPMN